MKLIFLFVILIFSYVFCENSNEPIQTYLRKEYSLSKPYQSSGITIPKWDFFGSTIVTQDFIRLTPDIQSKRGGIFNNIPVNFKNWEIIFQIKIDSKKKKELYGDGMAFWYVKYKSISGPVFGYQDQFNGLGVFFDTYANQNGFHNHGHPYISAMINNGSLHYDHDVDGTHTELSGCEAKFRSISNDVLISVKYLNNVLNVSTDIEGKDEFKECFSVNDVFLPTGYFFGFTAATGDLSDNHFLYLVKTYELRTLNQKDEDHSSIIPNALHSAPHRAHVDDLVRPMSNFKFFIIVVCVIILVVLLAAIGILVFNKQNENSKKRFY